MRGWTNLTRPGLFAVLVTAATALARPALAQPADCSTQNGTYTCNTSGTSTTNGFYGFQNGNPNTLPMTVTSNGNVAFGVTGSAGDGLNFGSTAASGGNTNGLQLTNSGTINLTVSPDTSQTGIPVTGIRVTQAAGDASSGGGNGGSSQAGVTVTNQNSITISLPSLQVSNYASGIWADERGGAGVLQGAGGSSAGAAVDNSGAVSLTATGAQGAAGILASSLGGDGGNGSTSNGGAGGNAGSTSVTSSAPVSLNWTWNNVGTNLGLYGIQALSEGGIGGSALNEGSGGSNGENGGNGGNGSSASVTLNLGANVSVTENGTPPSGAPFVPSAGVSAAVIGGNGGYPGYNDNQNGGAGGVVQGNAQISVTDANVATSGNQLPGLLAYLQGGAGGNGNVDGWQAGGAGGDVDGSGSVSVSTATTSVTISTAGTNSPAVAALAQGGAGGVGGTQNRSTPNGGAGGDAGSVNGTVTVNLNPPGTSTQTITLTTNGSNSPGVYTASIGGNGGAGGDAQTGIGTATALGGGNGGSGNNVTVNVAETSITTQASSSPGVVAISQGGVGGAGGNAATNVTEPANGGNGGTGGNTGAVAVAFDTGSSIATQGSDAMGILAQTISGAGGNAGGANGSPNSPGTGGTAGNAGNVTVTNNGTISTQGNTARGILAQSLGGSGGTGGIAWGWSANGGSGGASGTLGIVGVTNAGSIGTSGAQAEGVLMQSIGGSGGAGGSASALWSSKGGLGGTASSNPFLSSGSTVSFTDSGGSITTNGMSAIGVLEQSIGGGGGDGGNGSALTASIGGQGGQGGTGGTVTGELTSGSEITTNADVATGIELQSIGGGGGNGGNSNSNGLFASLSLGGTSVDAGEGGTATLSATGATITTVGSKAPGLVVQSIGGGGGSGGEAFAGSIGAGFSASIAVGGTGGAGGYGGWASATLAGTSVATGQNAELVNGSYLPQGQTTTCPSSLPCNILPVDSYGVVVQSIGGGGGMGGNAVAKALTIAVPTPPSGNQIAVSASAALGGTGGSGGNGGLAEFSLSNGSSIVTRGQGSTAVLAQSIGGGGGAGGDSSALAVALGYNKVLPGETSSTGLTGTFQMGGTGGTGGNGSNVNVALSGTVSNGNFTQDSSTDTPTSITTYGDFADGIKAQSIGGGGGDAGVGSSNTQQFGTGTSYKFSLNLGAEGGAGGTGEPVQVTVFPNSAITTWGSGAVGVLAQSIGGGGGASQGGSLAASKGSGFDVKLGTTGAGGGGGGNVTLSIQSPVTTYGGDATAVLAQSIGGGGGLGGSSGSDASADNPITGVNNERQAASGIANYLAGQGSIQTNFSISLGGSGGQGGNGGTVTVGSNNNISTSGDWANGIVAQSIGGGGGKAGTAAATGSGSAKNVTININEAIGGTGGAGGSGGSVTVALGPPAAGETDAIKTGGFAAAGVIAQSIGGGGGLGADGSDSATGTISVGNATDGYAGASGHGGVVCVDCSGTAAATIATTGAIADGVILQSVGGGGGISGTGNHLWGDGLWTAENGTLTLTAGGGSGALGDGGSVTFGTSGATGPLSISTTGYDAYGILAQSIGGGGGIISTQPVATSFTYTLGSLGSGNGGAVSIYLPSGGSGITTTGIAAHGVVAQSIGGGGGIMRNNQWYTDTPALTTSVSGWTSAGNSLNTNQGSGNGGDVTVVNDATINVSGPGSIGIVAQSIGGGGGLLAQNDQIFAGTVSTSGSNTGGAVNVTSIGSVSATGPNAIGIFAQSTGSPGGTRFTLGVRITVVGLVSGGSGTAGTPTQPGSSGVQIDSPAGNNGGLGNYLENYGAITTQLGTNGTAVLQTGGGDTELVNLGGITGSVYLNGGTFVQEETYNPGPDINANIVNSGTVNLVPLGQAGEFTSNLTGSYTQTNSGQLQVLVDSLHKRATQLAVTGTATVGGTIVPTAVTLLPGALPVVTASNLGSSARGLNSMLFNWDVGSSGNTLTLSPSSNFAPGEASLTASESSLAGYMTRAWNNADAAFATRFATLSQLNDPSQYKTMLDAYSGKAAEAQSLALINSAGTILGSAMSCPEFVDQSVLLGEGNCAWAKVTGQLSSQWNTGDTQGYHVSSAIYRLGAQHEVAPNWYLGGSLGFGQTWATTDGTASGYSDGYGQTYDGSVALKYSKGPWLFAGSVALAGGSFHSSRLIDIPGADISLQGSPSAFLAGGRLRAGYEFAFDDWYIRPYGDLDLLYTDLPGFRESGPALYALDVQASSKTRVALSPMVEFGGRWNLNAKTTLRPFAAVGLSILPDNTRSIDASFVGASPEDGTFRSFLNSPNMLGNVELGVQLYRAGGFEVKAEYDASIGGSFLSQSASARLAYDF